MTATKLKSVFADYGPARLLRNGTVVPDGFELEFVDTGTPVQGMARMVRDLEFDMVDMSPTTYFAARSLGVPLIALPITMYAEYPHALLWTHKMSNIRQPSDLAGKTIGVRTWLNPATIWLRGMLAGEYAVELDDVQWSLTVPDTLNVVPIPPNAKRSLSDPRAFKLLEMVQTGEADAVVDALTLQWHHALEQKKVDPALAEPLFPDSPQYTAALHRYFGYIPIMHMVVVKAATLEANPTAVRALFDAFARAKNLYCEGLRSAKGDDSAGREAWLVARDRDNRELLDIGIDPLPMGDEVARILDTLLGFMVKYGYIPKPLDIATELAPIR